MPDIDYFSRISNSARPGLKELLNVRKHWRGERNRTPISYLRSTTRRANSLFSIFSKLTALGWGKEIKIIVEMRDTGLDPLSSHAMIKQPEDLTDRSK